MTKLFWPLWLGLQLAPAPILSTADRIAIQDCEQKKAEAQKEFNDASQAEVAIGREFAAAHPGFHLNPQSFAVEADPKVESKVGPQGRK